MSLEFLGSYEELRDYLKEVESQKETFGGKTRVDPQDIISWLVELCKAIQSSRIPTADMILQNAGGGWTKHWFDSQRNPNRDYPTGPTIYFTDSREPIDLKDALISLKDLSKHLLKDPSTATVIDKVSYGKLRDWLPD